MYMCLIQKSINNYVSYFNLLELIEWDVCDVHTIYPLLSVVYLEPWVNLIEWDVCDVRTIYPLLSVIYLEPWVNLIVKGPY